MRTPSIPSPIVAFAPATSLFRLMATTSIGALESAVQAGSRRNAWAAVCADRARAQVREKAQSAADAVMRALPNSREEPPPS